MKKLLFFIVLLVIAGNGGSVAEAHPTPGGLCNHTHEEGSGEQAVQNRKCSRDEFIWLYGPPPETEKKGRKRGSIGIRQHVDITDVPVPDPYVEERVAPPAEPCCKDDKDEDVINVNVNLAFPEEKQSTVSQQVTVKPETKKKKMEPAPCKKTWEVVGSRKFLETKKVPDSCEKVISPSGTVYWECQEMDIYERVYKEVCK